MKRSLLIALLLAGCQSSEERLAAQNARDDQQCLSYGAQKGSDGYVACRAQLSSARRTDSAIRGGPQPGCSQFLNISYCN
jgi:hypothetical protein